MNKLYSVHDHWMDINKKNDVDIESIDGVITGIKVNGEDYGGGTSWTEVFSGDVVTTGEAAPFSGTINANLSGSDTIKVFYNDTEYILPKQVTDYGIFYGAPAAENPDDIDFSEIPFIIDWGEVSRLYTQSPGQQDLTILEPQSGGGSSDFSTAEVTFENVDDTTNPYYLSVTAIKDNMIKIDYEDVSLPVTITVPLYKGTNILPVDCISNADESYMPTTEGSVEFSMEPMGFVVTGNGTIKAKGRTKN